MRPVLSRLVTQERLDAGIWTGTPEDDRACIVCAVPLLGLSLFMLWYTEVLAFAGEQEIATARGSVVELPCSRSGLGLEVASESVVHLTGCKLNHLTDFTIKELENDGLEFIGGFQENMPATGVKGAYFKVHLKQCTGSRRRCSYDSVDAVENLEALTLISNTARIGTYEASDDVWLHLPGSVVPLRPSSHFHQELGMFSSVTSPYSSKNMQTLSNVLYDAPGEKYDDEVKMWFTVADGPEISLLARQHNARGLSAWKVPGLEDLDEFDFTRAVKGSQSAHAMIGQVEEDLSGFSWSLRRIFTICAWLGTWMLLFPTHACDCCCRKKPDLSCCRALPLAMVPSVCVIVTSWGFLRNPFFTMCTSALLLVLCMAILYSTREYESFVRGDLVGAAAQVAHVGQQSLTEAFLPVEVDSATRTQGMPHARSLVLGMAIGLAVTLAAGLLLTFVSS